MNENNQLKESRLGAITDAIRTKNLNTGDAISTDTLWLLMMFSSGCLFGLTKKKGISDLLNSLYKGE